jgi:tetraacyldisaccharide 4'-kinase
LKAAWLYERAPSASRRLALLPLRVASWLYGVGAAAHRGSYAAGLRRPRRLACRVVSVGNLVVGGTGKTPIAAWIAAELARRGHRVALVCRGVGALEPQEIAVAADGSGVRASLREVGEEALLLARLAPGVPVLAGRKRARVGARAIMELGARVLVLDDGFQHHALARDVDLVCFGSDGLGNGALLPHGPLRERVRVLERADALLVAGGRLPFEDEARIASAAPGIARFTVVRTAERLSRLGEPAASESPSALAGRAVGLLSAIARPDSLRATLERLGARVVAERRFPDHHVYRAQDVARLAGAPLWVTTEKDAMKLAPEWLRGADVRVLSERTAIEPAEAFLAWLEGRL